MPGTIGSNVWLPTRSSWSSAVLKRLTRRGRLRPSGGSAGPNMVPLHRLEALLVQVVAIRAAVGDQPAVSTL